METLTASLRQLRTHRVSSAVVILLLALGIGASTAIFGVVHAVLLKPLPYPEPGDLVLARKPPRDAGTNLPGGGDMMPDNEFLAWVDAVPKSFRSLAAYRNSTSTLQRDDSAVRIPTAAVTGEFFPMLGVSAWRGRLFGADDLKPGAAPVTVLSHSAWQTRFNGEDSALGQVVKIDDVAHTIIGVLPPPFEFTEPVQFWRPLAVAPSAPGQFRIQMVRVFGRLLPGTELAAAQRELDGISERYWNNLANSFGGPQPGPAAQAGPRGPGGFRLPFADSRAQLVPLQEQLAKQSRTTLWLLLGAVGFVLLIACANIANLQLARTAARRREAAVRAALGASPTRLASELLLENLALALLGGLLGIFLAWAGTQLLQAWLSDFLPRVNPVGINATVLGFALLLATAAGLGFGLAPAWQGSRVDLVETLKDGGQQSSPAGHRWKQALVALEVALALVLAINTALLVKSIRSLYATELGYRTGDVMTASLVLPRRYSQPAQLRDFASRWLDTLRTLPGVKTAAIADIPPLSPFAQMTLIATAQGSSSQNASVSAAPRSAATVSVSPDFFAATGIRLVDGRFFTESDGADAPSVTIVNEAYARLFYPEGLTLGAETTIPAGHGTRTTRIVGVVADVRPRGFDSSAQATIYSPSAQVPASRLSVVVHFTGDAAVVARAIAGSTIKLDPGLALDTPQTLEQQIARQTAPRRVTLALTGAFAAVAVILAMLGIFGVMSYTVAQRTPEIGVRMALGADGPSILRWMLGYGGGAIAAGLLIGLGLTLATSRLLQAQLTGVTALDTGSVVAGMAAMALAGFAACLLPALRATRINPVQALRNE